MELRMEGAVNGHKFVITGEGKGQPFEWVRLLRTLLIFFVILFSLGCNVPTIRLKPHLIKDIAADAGSIFLFYDPLGIWGTSGIWTKNILRKFTWRLSKMNSHPCQKSIPKIYLPLLYLCKNYRAERLHLQCFFFLSEVLLILKQTFHYLGYHHIEDNLCVKTRLLSAGQCDQDVF